MARQKKVAHPSPAMNDPAAEPQKVVVELDPVVVSFLEVLATRDIGTSVADVLRYLAQTAADGVLRPGSWERGWVATAFGDAWTDRTKAHPTEPWRVVPNLPKRAAKPRKGGA